MLIRTTLLTILCFTLITNPLQAQNGDMGNTQDNIQDNKPVEEQHLTYAQMTELMVNELHLNEKQQVKLTKINRRFKNLIEGEQRQLPMMGEQPEGGMGGGPSGGGMMGGGPSGGGMMGGGMMGGGPSGGGMMGGRPSGGMGGGMMGGGPRGGGMMDGPRGGGGPQSYDYDRQQSKYDKAVRKLFTDDQYEGYKKIKSQFYSQRRIRDFLLGNQHRI